MSAQCSAVRATVVPSWYDIDQMACVVWPSGKNKTNKTQTFKSKQGSSEKIMINPMFKIFQNLTAVTITAVTPTAVLCWYFGNMQLYLKLMQW